MTSTITRSTLDVLTHATVAQLSTTIWLPALGVLALVLIEREVLRAAAPSALRPALAMFDVVGVPLLIVFLTAVAVRFAALT
jgi:hypothetical protein